ncbi:MAG: Rieske 2Fe-2S domain-containing protein [Phycisphaerales bacterium]
MNAPTSVREPILRLTPQHTGANGFASSKTLASWYCLGRANHVKRGRVTAMSIGSARIALWRDEHGRIDAVPARCPHLGADLTQGRVERGSLICPMHAWKFGASGRACLPVVEAHGLVFVRLGDEPTISETWVRMPGEALDLRKPWLLPSQTIRASGHLVLGNGFDTGHYGPLHGVELEDARVHDLNASAVYPVNIRARLTGKRRWSVLGMHGTRVEARFIGVGAGLTWVVCREPLSFAVLFSATPIDVACGGGCRTQVAFFPPSGSSLRKLKALALMYGLVYDDRRVLERMRFQRNWTSGDACLRGYAEMIDRLPACDGDGGRACD